MTSMRVASTGVAVAVAVLFAVPAQAEIKKDWIEYNQGSTKLKGYLVHDTARTGKRPAVLMIHAREGMSQKTLQLAETWAKFGYVTFAADIFGYGQGVLPKTVEEMSAQTGVFRKDRALLRARTQAGYDTIAKNSLVDGSRIALIGYCFGGSTGVEFGATGAPLALNVSIHGSFGGHAPGWAKNAKGRFLILHGSEDKGYSLATAVAPVIDELRTAHRPFQLELYSGTGHGFSSPKNKDEERANAQSIASAARTMREVFGE